MRRVEVLNLAHGEVEERHIVLDLERRLGASHAHRRAQATVDLEHGELVEDAGVRGRLEGVVGDDLLGRG